MKHCPTCNRVENDDTLAFCRVDGTLLVDDSSPAAESATRVLEHAKQITQLPKSSTTRLKVSTPSVLANKQVRRDN